MLQDTQGNDRPAQTVLFMHAEELRVRLRYVSVRECLMSQLPIRLERKRDGVVLGSYESREKALDSLVHMPEHTFNPIKTKGRRR